MVILLAFVLFCSSVYAWSCFSFFNLGLIGDLDTASDDSVDPYDLVGTSTRKHKKSPLSKILGNGHAYTTLERRNSGINSDDDDVADMIYHRNRDKVLFDRYGPDFSMMGSTDSLSTAPGERALDNEASDDNDEHS
jgi:hypothetical protein